MRSVLFLATAALSLFAGLSTAAPAPIAPSSEMLRRHIENEPSAMFSKRQLLEEPSRVKTRRAVARANASPAPNPYKYNVEIINSDGSVLGYLARGASSADYWSFTTSKSSAIAVAAPTPNSYSNLAFASSGNNNVGAFVGPNSASDTMASGSYNYVPLTGSAATPANSTPASASNDYDAATGKSQKVETAVWQYNSSNGGLSLSWVNPNGARITMSGMIGINYRNVFLVGDRSAFASHFNGDTYYQVTFKLTLI